MKHLVVLVTVALGLAPSEPAPKAPPAPADAPAAAAPTRGPAPTQVRIARCVRVAGQARYGAFGYDHVVHVSNECDKDVACDVSTNVDPHPRRVRVNSKKRTSVLTRRGAPSPRFTPRASCWFIK